MTERPSHVQRPPGGKTRPQQGERREPQERQKAAKASPNNVTDKYRKPTEAKHSSKPKSVSHISTKDSASVVSTDADHVLRHLRIFSHFVPSGKTPASSNNKVEIHPAILRLALQFSEFRIVGGNARCIATVEALKEVIHSYHTPAHNSLPRHIMTYISPQISHIREARPLSVGAGNAIRYLKSEITSLASMEDDIPERDAKELLCERLDNFIRDRITLADYLIQTTAVEKITENSVILTFAKSSVVEQVIFRAFEAGKKFTVWVIDSGPLFEGRRLLHSLKERGINCSYAYISALGTVIASANLVLLGAHSLYANGALYSRAGTALVAMMASQRSIPVLACCETYKFSNKVPFDGFIKNELAMAHSPEPQAFLQTLNPLYDLTPASAITAVVTEIGLIPPSSVPTVLFRAGVQEE